MNIKLPTKFPTNMKEASEMVKELCDQVVNKVTELCNKTGKPAEPVKTPESVKAPEAVAEQKAVPAESEKPPVKNDSGDQNPPPPAA